MSELDVIYGQDGISVVIPSFNKFDNLARTLLSIIYQDYEGNLPIEVIIIDDGSIDGTGDKIKEIISDVPKWLDIRYLHSGKEVNEWTSPSIPYNLGFSKVRYRYVIHNSADSLWADDNFLDTIILHRKINRYIFVKLFELQKHFDYSYMDIFDIIEYSSPKKCNLKLPFCVMTSKYALDVIGMYGGGYKPGANEDIVLIKKFETIGAEFFFSKTNRCVVQKHKKGYIRNKMWNKNTRHNRGLCNKEISKLKDRIKSGRVAKIAKLDVQ